MCDVCSPLAAPADAPVAAAPLPEDIAGAIHRAVLELRWPLGRTGLTAMLRGSMSAPRSAQRSPHFGLLAAASQADVKRWIQLLELAGALESFESEDGFRLLRAVPWRGAAADRQRPRRPARPTKGLFERLRAWRLERAREDEVPAYVVLHDATLRELASVEARERARSGRGQGLRADQARALRGRRPRRDRSRLTPDRGYHWPLAAVQQEQTGAPATPHPQASSPRASHRPPDRRVGVVQLRPDHVPSPRRSTPGSSTRSSSWTTRRTATSTTRTGSASSPSCAARRRGR